MQKIFIEKVVENVMLSVAPDSGWLINMEGRAFPANCYRINEKNYKCFPSSHIVGSALMVARSVYSRLNRITSLLMLMVSLVFCSCLGFTAALAEPQENTTELKITLDRVTFRADKPQLIFFFVTITDPQGRPITNLNPDNFRLTWDAQPLTVTEVKPIVVTDRKLAFVLMVDHRHNLPTSVTLIREAALEFFSRMGFRYPGSLVSYSGCPSTLVGPTSDMARLRAAAVNLTPVAGPCRLYDGLLMAGDTLNQTRPTPDRLALILFTDGQDQDSLFSRDAAWAKIMETGSSVYVVVYGHDLSQQIDLEKLATDTGGAFLVAHQPDDLVRYAGLIADRIQNQYVLMVEAKDRKVQGNTVRVEMEIVSRQGRGRCQSSIESLETTEVIE